MKTNVEVLESGATELTVTVEAAEVDARIKKTYQEFSRKYRFPGFRAGHVPRPVIDNTLGKDAVASAVTDDIINETYPLAIDENDLCLIGAPKFGEIAGLVEGGKDFVYTVELTVKPAFELTDYAPVKVEVPKKEATDEEIDEQIKGLTEYYYDFKDAAANAKIAEGGFAEIALHATDAAGEALPAFESDGRLYELGQGLFPEAFDKELVGMKKGQTKTIELDVKENPCMLFGGLADKTATVTFEVEVKVVKKKIYPEITDEWVKETLHFEDVADLRAKVAQSVEAQKGQMIPRILENNVLFELQKRLDGEAPESMRDESERDLLQNFFMQLQNQGATLDAYLAANDITADQFKEDVKKQAEDVVKQNLALDAYARHAGIVVTDEEVTEEFATSGADDPDALFAEWKAEGRLHIVREGIMRGKALEAAIAEAEVTEVDKLTPAEEEPAKKPAKKAAAKKSSAKKTAKKDEAETAEAAEAEEKPAKKTAKKSSAKKASEARDAEEKVEE